MSDPGDRSFYMQGFRRVLAGLAIAATLATGTACSAFDSPVTCWDASDGQHYCADHEDGTVTHNDRSQVPEKDADLPPYCMIDAEDPRHITVAGPAGGWVTVNGRDHAALTLVLPDDDGYGSEVAPDAGPYDGLLYNVPGPGTVAVDGKVCEPT